MVDDIGRNALMLACIAVSFDLISTLIVFTLSKDSISSIRQIYDAYPQLLECRDYKGCSVLEVR